MAGLLFESFEMRESGQAPSGTIVAVPSPGAGLDRRILRLATTSDSILYNIEVDPYGTGYNDVIGPGRQLGTNGSLHTAYGYSRYFSSGFSVQSWMNYNTGSAALAVPQASLKSPTPTELWFTCDIRVAVTYLSDMNDPANLARSENRCQIFRWGDLSLRLYAIQNPLPSPNRGDVIFGLYNGTTLLGTVTVPNVNSTDPLVAVSGPWIYVKVHAKLDSTTGAFEVTCDGHTASYTNINSVATTPASNATYIYFSGGALGSLTSTSGPINFGGIDNVYIDDSGFPPNRPCAIVLQLGTASTDNQWTAAGPSATTLADALAAFDSRVARGVGVGSRMFVNLSAVNRSTSGIVDDVLGVQYIASGISNINLTDARRVKAGIRFQPVGTVFGTRYPTYQPPATPSYIIPGKEDTSWKRADNTTYQYSDFNNSDTGAQLVFEIIDPGPT